MPSSKPPRLRDTPWWAWPLSVLVLAFAPASWRARERRGLTWAAIPRRMLNALARHGWLELHRDWLAREEPRRERIRAALRAELGREPTEREVSERRYGA